ncbi:MAG: IS30 family transposase [Pelolinea sp.]|nr:IS30 family transposase [Pelolinea sp.]
MRIYTQLTHIQRYQIYALLNIGHSNTGIAQTIGVHKSTIGREIKRNRGQKGYRPKQAHQIAMERRDKAKKRISAADWEGIDQLIKLDWSPEQISDQLGKERMLQISHEWIYQHIYQDKRSGGILWQHLRCRKKRRKRYGSYEKRGQIPNRVWIDERPQVVEQRERLGDWEADTIISKGKQKAIVTLTERKSRMTLLKKVEDRTAETVKQAIIDLLRPFVDQTLTITCDNGKEFSEHIAIAQALNANVYFAHPQAAWERGSNENANGLIRQYFPKGTDFSTLAEKDIELVILRLNHRPRKCLGFSSPNMVFFQEMQVALKT